MVDRLAKENQVLRERIADQSHIAQRALQSHKEATEQASKKKQDLDAQLLSEKE